MSEEIKKDKVYWEDRFWNPMIRMNWNSAIEIISPADRGKGIFHGTRKYPDGTLEEFTVAHN